MRAVVYLRVSTAKQELSPEAQKQRALEFAKFAGLEVPEGYVVVGPAISGKTRFEDRACGREALRLLETADAIIFAKLSRAFRNAADALTLVPRLIAAGKRVLFLDMGVDTSTPTGKMVMGMLAVLAEWEADIIAERTREALAVLHSQGRRPGPARIGFRNAGKGVHVPNEAEARLMARIRELQAAGCTNVAIADRLNAEGFRTRRGAAFRHVQVGRALGASA